MTGRDLAYMLLGLALGAYGALYAVLRSTDLRRLL